MRYVYRGTDRQHGRASTYQWAGCRCQECTEAATQKTREVRGSTRIIDATPARDHIQALRDAGLRVDAIARLTGYHVNTIARIGSGGVRAREDTVRDICALPIPRAVAA